MKKRSFLKRLVGVGTGSGSVSGSKPSHPRRSGNLVPFYSAFQPGTVVRLSSERGFNYVVVLSEKEATEANGREWAAGHSAEVMSGVSFYFATAASVFNPPPGKVSANLGATLDYIPVNPVYEIHHLRDTGLAQKGLDSMELSVGQLSNVISGLERFVSVKS